MADSEAPLDEQLELKKRARRRLVGATALVLLAAIVLPMVMDREPRPVNPDIQVRIPSQDGNGGFVAHVAPAKPVATPLPPVTPAAPPVAEPVVAKSEAKVEAPAPKEAAKPAEKKADEARAADVLAGGASEQWVIQLGAYKEAGNVKLLLAKLKGMGVPAYTEKFDSPQGPRTRVRAGPFPSKDAAEKALTKVKIVGVDGPIAPK